MPWGPKRTLHDWKQKVSASAAHFRSPLTRTIPVKTKTSSFGWKVPQVRFFPKFIFGILAHTNTEQLYNLSHMKLWMLRKQIYFNGTTLSQTNYTQKEMRLAPPPGMWFSLPHVHNTSTHAQRHKRGHRKEKNLPRLGWAHAIAHSGARCGIFLSLSF